LERLQDRFETFAREIATATGRPTAFLVALGIVLIWGATGPFFDFSDTWQLVINTGTTIVTFLMVFLIQESQNRDTRALQVKLSELIMAVQGAENTVAIAEDLSERELEELHRHYTERAKETYARLESARERSPDDEDDDG
jgi:low affinity Fe/Cu permease